MKRLRIKVTGIVQGVGFRPFIYHLANEHRLTGFVRNDGSGVTVEVQGKKAENFFADIARKAPATAYIETIDKKELPPVVGEAEFIILHSDRNVNKNKYISPDIALCEYCKNEILTHKTAALGIPLPTALIAVPDLP